MNDLIPTEPRRPPAGGGADPQMIGSAFRKAQAQWVALFDDYDRLSTEYRDMSRVVSEGDRNPVRTDYISREEQRSRELREARSRLAYIAPPEVLEPVRTKLQAAGNTAFDAKRSRLMVGMLVDGFPNARPHSPVVYIEAIMHELEVAAVSPAAVAKACSDIRREATYPPAVAEILTAAKKAHGALVYGARYLGHAMEVRTAAAEAAAALEALGEITPEREGQIKAERDAAYEARRPRISEETWRARVEGFKANGTWDASWGERPDEVFCQAGKAILQPLGYWDGP